MPYKITGSVGQEQNLVILDSEGNLQKTQTVSGDYEVDGISAPNGIIFTTDDLDEIVGYGNVDFIHYSD
jgi:hypothetical protein